MIMTRICELAAARCEPHKAVYKIVPRFQDMQEQGKTKPTSARRVMPPDLESSFSWLADRWFVLLSSSA